MLKKQQNLKNTYKTRCENSNEEARGRERGCSIEVKQKASSF
ncbi:hypothetical protein MADA3029_1210017 [Vibrio nigripulchritudo MADA3029]|nr:hypothetical protein MADA3029_1210017 [Vibrio nigripulchritudo MADA3029]